MAGAAGVGAGDHPDAVGAVVAADEDLLAGDHVLVAVADGRRRHAGEVGAGAGLAQELPGAHLARVDRRQERLLLRLRTPDEDRRGAEAPAAIVVGRQGEVEAVDLLLEDDRVVDVEPAAAVLRGRPRVEPPLGAEPEPERAQFSVTPVVVLAGDGRPRDVGGHVVLEPRADLAAEALLLLGIRDLEIHGTPSLSRPEVLIAAGAVGTTAAHEASHGEGRGRREPPRPTRVGPVRTTDRLVGRAGQVKRDLVRLLPRP